MTGNLVVHAGGFEATEEQLLAVPVPAGTRHYKPVAHVELLNHVRGALEPAGLTLKREQFALAHKGSQMFAVLDVQNGHNASDYSLTIGLRNSYDKSLAVGLCAGSRVFVCDNLAFNGEVKFTRKHTRGVWEELPELVSGLLGETVGPYAERQEIDINRMKEYELSGKEVDHWLMEAFRNRVIPAGDIPDVLHNWTEPPHPEFQDRTAWSLFNAFTEAFKMTSGPLHFERSLRLSKLFRELIPSSN